MAESTLKKEVVLRDENDIDYRDKITADIHSTGTMYLFRYCRLGGAELSELIHLTANEARELVKALEDVL